MPVQGRYQFVAGFAASTKPQSVPRSPPRPFDERKVLKKVSWTVFYQPRHALPRFAALATLTVWAALTKTALVKYPEPGQRGSIVKFGPLCVQPSERVRWLIRRRKREDQKLIVRID